MTTAVFYRRAAFVPVIVPVVTAISLGVLIATGAQPSPVMSAVVDVLGYSIFAGAWSALPYGVFVLIARRWFRPRTASQFRRLSWAAPVLIAVPFGLLHATVGAVERGWRTALPMLVFWGGQALVVGIAYSALINGSLVIAQRLNWVVRGDDPPSRVPPTN
jgi:membrane protease YdiL (CAAX protease family)